MPDHRMKPWRAFRSTDDGPETMFTDPVRPVADIGGWVERRGRVAVSAAKKGTRCGRPRTSSVSLRRTYRKPTEIHGTAATTSVPRSKAAM